MNELTINQAKAKMDEMWHTIEQDENRVADRVGVLAVQFRLMSFTNDRIQSAEYRGGAEMDAFYARRSGDVEAVAECEAIIDEMNYHLDYDRAETKRINELIGSMA